MNVNARVVVTIEVPINGSYDEGWKLRDIHKDIERQMQEIFRTKNGHELLNALAARGTLINGYEVTCFISKESKP